MPVNFAQFKDELLFVPLGGSNEIGMNLNLYHYQGKWIMIDCGIGFADAHFPGIDIMLPDIEFIRQNKHNLLGLVLTHAHEDHVGGVHYLWEDFKCPVYATPFTAAFLKTKLTEAGMQNQVKVHEVEAGSRIKLGPFDLEMVPLTHSIPEMQAIAIRTDKGVIMHTGDWKFDDDPLVGPVSDEETLGKYGDEGVLALVCDSTNVFVEGVSGSEAGVRKNLVRVISECPNRVAVTTFASNLARLETIIMAGTEAGRRIVLAGRSLWRIVEAARESGYLNNNIELIHERQAMEIPRHEALIICTGCQGEPMAALSRLAREEHPSIRFARGDTVIFSSRKIPGNEKRIGWMQNSLVEHGVEIITDSDEHIHVSGHPARGELKRMYELIRPHIAIPTHGETRHIHEQSKFARALGVPHSLEMRNGSVALLSREEPRILGEVKSGYVVVDGQTLLPADSPVIRTRRKLRDEGCVAISIVLSKKNELILAPKIVSPGSMDKLFDKDLLTACIEEVEDALENMKPSETEAKIEERVRAALRRIFKMELGKKPVIEVLLHRA